ncbi:hypothetical protein [Parasitella parasitica]|uniref:Kinesin-like protein n=1 Tax=Parasitella parasitica TaxID=35722 RepID=A0A0B7MUR8_9FUNG|nr:hypothetical protein [Parasitella parasitica]
MTLSHSEGPITPPATPLWNQSSAKFSSNIPIPMSQATASSINHNSYPSPTTSSSRSSSSASLRPSFSTRSTSIRENVQVMVRCRPRSEKELEYPEEPCWLINPEEGLIEQAKLKAPNSTRTFYYDNVVMGTDNAQVYKAGILDLVRSAMMGYNGTENEPGVIPRAVEDVFSYIEDDTNGREYLLRVSYMEIYNEKIKDLLCVENTSPEIIEDKKGVHVRNLKEVIVKTSKEVMDCIREGEGNRHISATDYNEHSSRSHTIFQLVIESRSKGIPTSENRGVRLSQLNLIDLAGSEKVATDIERRKEGAYINKSLLTLGNVISKLTSDEPASHIPFRNSKLTRILQAALSGNARISVICTINPTFASKDESLNTLRFAQRAKLVKTAAQMTRIVDNSELQNCLLKIEELQTKMQEKNDLEAETRERLTSLLSLILTSSKDHDENQHSEGDKMYARLSNITSDDLKNDATMRDVVARCEEGIAAQVTAHNKQMAKMTTSLESMQDMLNVMEAAHDKQQDALARRDAQIDKLKQELSHAKANMMMRPSKIPMGPPQPAVVAAVSSSPSSSTTSKKPVNNNNNNNKKAAAPLTQPSLADLTPAIAMATQKITAAISSALQLDKSSSSSDDDDEYDMLSASLTSSTDPLSTTTTTANISKAISSVIQKALFSSQKNSMPQKDIECDTIAITNAIQNAVKNAAHDEAISSPSMVTSSDFTPIHEAVSFVHHSVSSEFIMESAVMIDEPDREQDVPALVQHSRQAARFDAGDPSDSSDADDVSDEQELPSFIEEHAQSILDTSNQEAQHYEPYAASIEQPSILPILFNKWTLFMAVIYILSQY